MELVREAEAGWSQAEVVQRFPVSRPTVQKWIRRLREAGAVRLEDRNSTPLQAWNCCTPDRPQTNGKAERFIQILQNEWAYARPYGSNAERLHELPRWLYRYNHRRPRGGVGGAVPASRL